MALAIPLNSLSPLLGYKSKWSFSSVGLQEHTLRVVKHEGGVWKVIRKFRATLLAFPTERRLLVLCGKYLVNGPCQ